MILPMRHGQGEADTCNIAVTVCLQCRDLNREADPMPEAFLVSPDRAP